MNRYKITTLVDITRSRPSRYDPNEIKQGQQSNFNTLLQAIGLRANIASDTDPKQDTGRLPEPFNGKGTYWVYEFEPERADSFLDGDNPVGHLINDLNGVPIIDRLNNSIDFDLPVFKTLGNQINTLVQKLD
jgi:hypothetical protein